MMGSTAARLTAGVLWGVQASSQPAADPRGVWVRDDGNARIEIADCGPDLCATNLWIGDTSGGELVGDRLVLSLQPRSATSLAGRAYDPKRDRTYSLTVEVGHESLVTRGCLFAILCRSVSWTLDR